MSQNQQPQNACPNCGTLITCSCQTKLASDGKNVCNNCAGMYEIQLQTLKNSIIDKKH